ncbi:MAG TPA: DUF1697 domain-containing protein [Anaerolineales bacterium]|nr:DUF1697 domain-containing protein [Anaerolineales bacterium]
MKTYIILLRGVTPTGKNKVLMAPLRAALEKAGLQDARTYIQSGIIVASSDLSQFELEKVVHDVIKDHFGGDIVVLARTASQFRDILNRNPFKKADMTKLYFTLLATRPDERLVKAFLAPGYSPDQVKVISDVVYVLTATQYSDLKANNNFIERKLRVAATTRVYNTVSRLVELSAEE